MIDGIMSTLMMAQESIHCHVIGFILLAKVGIPSMHHLNFYKLLSTIVDKYQINLKHAAADAEYNTF